MNAIITGAGGLIGSRFFELYSEKFKKIYQLGRTRAEIDAEWLEYDLSSGRTLSLPSVDALFHFAGQTSVHHSKEDVLNDLVTNVIGLIQVLDALRNNGNKPFVLLAGTATEVGYSDERMPIDEEYCSNPITFYDISKLTAERYLLQYVREGWIDGCALRLCNVYGGTRDGQNCDRGIIDKIFQRALKGESVNIYGSGNYLRDYIHLDDVVAAFYLAWENRNQVNGQYFNLGTGVGTTLKEAFCLVSMLAEEVSGKKVILSSVDPPDGLSQIEYRSFVADNRKFLGATNWRPRHTLESGIRYSYRNLFDS